MGREILWITRVCSAAGMGGTGQGDAHGSSSASCVLSSPLSSCIHGFTWIYRALGWSWDRDGITAVPLCIPTAVSMYS